ncbi:hypothetical protein FG467_003536 [Yersinia enterocolitica]|nr:hypothetical protein [Yersinia enterocolitica]EKN5119448.1 hypothetical protein [Yersinia enterocolitica]EKN5955669.1 hypothetical protein [Yersinia enterocolitica]
MNNDEALVWYARLGSDGKIESVSPGDQSDHPGMILVDFSSEIYREFYNRMPVWIQWGIPTPTEDKAA